MNYYPKFHTTSYYKIPIIILFLAAAAIILPSEDQNPENTPAEESSQPARPNDTGRSGGSSLLEKKRPEDKIFVGQWARYQIRRYKKDAADDTINALSEADIKISIIGKETVIENEYLWAEFVINEGRAEQRIVRLMADREGKPAPERLVLKYGKLPAVEIHLRIWEVKTRITREMLFDEMTSELNIIPFTRILTPEVFDESSVTYETLPIKIGPKETSLGCTRVLLKQEGAQPARPDGRSGGEPALLAPSATTGYIWYSDKVPLAGLVKLLVTEDRYRTMILLTDYGRGGARSLIRETPAKLDFREKAAAHPVREGNTAADDPYGNNSLITTTGLTASKHR
ncbi:MAG: hypothetical protein AB1599_00035 [Planctomycetota bacterium]